MSIFARQLQYVLEQHGNNLGQLYNIRIEDSGYDDGRPISPGNIIRLKQVVRGKYKGSVTLNAHELEAVQQAFSFTAEEKLRLRAALAAESILRFLSDRIELEKALLVSDALFQMLFDADDSAFIALRNRMINYIRGDDPASDEEVIAEQILLAELVPAIEVYDSALVWLDTARAIQNPISRQGYLAMVASLLTSTQELLTSLPEAIQETSQFAEWQQSVKEAVQEMQEIKGP